MSIAFHQLEAFVGAAEEGSFTSAARRMKKAQSAVSMLVSTLEDELGVQLFERSTRKPTLTDVGQRLLPEAKLLLDRREHFLGVARSYEEKVETRLVIAIDEIYPDRAVGALMSRFAAKFPHVELELLFPHSESIARLVQAGSVDLGVIWREESMPSDLSSQTLGWVPLVVVCSLSHELSKSTITWEDLRRYRQILASKKSDGEERRRLRVASEVWWVESHWVVLHLVHQGLGWALIPDHILSQSGLVSALATPLLSNNTASAAAVALEVVWHKQRSMGPAARFLRDHLLNRGL